MSLHVLANHMASKGRGEDSMLVHMTPEEVASLQTLAMKNGGSLTINPDTGLPEAGWLKKLLPMIAGAALNYFLPGVGTAISGALGIGGAAAGAIGTGIAVGGATGLATGSLSKGLMAGLGAYGGAGLGSALTGAGTASLTDQAISAGQGQLGAANLALGQALPDAAAKQFVEDATARQLAAATPFDKLGAGFSAVTDSPAAAGKFVGDNWKYGLAAAAPAIADAMVPTTVKAPEGYGASPGYIRPFQFDENTRTAAAQTPVLASEWGARQFPDYIRKTQMAEGGIVALADGGVSGGGSLDLHVPINLGGGGGGGGFDGGYTPIGSNGSVGNMNPNAGGNGFGGLGSLAGALGQLGGGQMNGLDSRAVQADPQGFQKWMQGAQQQEQQMPGSTMLAGYGGTAENGYMSPGGMDTGMFSHGPNPFMSTTRGKPFGGKHPSEYTPEEARAAEQMHFAQGGVAGYALGGLGTLGGYSDGGRLLKGPGDGVSDSIPATIGAKQQPARLADGEFVVPARIVSELGNGSTDAGARKLYAMMDRIQKARGKTIGKGKVAANPRADKHLPA
jgi:hypothetical protein